MKPFVLTMDFFNKSNSTEPNFALIPLGIERLTSSYAFSLAQNGKHRSAWQGDHPSSSVDRVQLIKLE